MRRLVTAVGVLALAAGAALITARDGAPATRAAVRVVSQQPLVLRGVGFKSRELVRITVNMDNARAARRVRAGSRGAFTASFDDLDYDPCGVVLVVRAAGSKGSVATLKVLQRECPPRP